MTPSHGGLPLHLGVVRRTRLLHADRVSSTWEGWEGWRGVRVHLRALSPGSRGDPVARAALQVAAAAPARLVVDHLDDGWPRVVTAPLRRVLADLTPIEADRDPLAAVRILVGVLGSLAALHASGHAHGRVDAEHVALDESGWRLVWLGPPVGERPADPLGDLRAVGLLATEVGPPDDPITALCAGFAEHPPPSAADAALLLHAALGERLAAERHALGRRLRGLRAESRRSRLRVLARRLAASPPPPGRGCVSAGGDSPLLVASDGQSVFGGGAPGGTLVGLPAVAAAGEVDVAAVRMLLRAWARRDGADPARQALNEGLGGDEVQLGRLMRWLSATSRLRVDLRLL